jgi:hypothetical protein
MPPKPALKAQEEEDIVDSGSDTESESEEDENTVSQYGFRLKTEYFNCRLITFVTDCMDDFFLSDHLKHDFLQMIILGVN